MPEVTAPGPHRERTRLTKQRPGQPYRPTDVEVETLALLTLGNDLRKLLDRRNDARRFPAREEVEATNFVRDRLIRLAPATPAEQAADGPARTPSTPDSAARANIQWQDEFLNLLVRAAKSVKRWLEGPDERADRLDPAPAQPDLRDLSTIDPRSDLYARTSRKLAELLDQNPALHFLSSNGHLDVASRHVPRGDAFGGARDLGGVETNPFRIISRERSRRGEHEDAHDPHLDREYRDRLAYHRGIRSTWSTPSSPPVSPREDFAALRSLRVDLTSGSGRDVPRSESSPPPVRLQQRQQAKPVVR